jgi:predicted ArsR family transcriptional regulator
MKKAPKMIEEKIQKCLKKQPMTIEEVSRELDISRATASKYLMALEIRGKVGRREIGRAKLFSLR